MVNTQGLYHSLIKNNALKSEMNYRQQRFVPNEQFLLLVAYFSLKFGEY